MKKIFLALLLPALVCAGAFAQNLNPTVTVTNTYLSKAGDAAKYVPAPDIPDSLKAFNYDFDYSVFATPYRGAYEFVPYSVEFNPERAFEYGTGLFVRAGAGYPLRPQLQAVWEPVNGDKFKMNVHQDFNGFIGQYRDVRKDISSSPMMTTKGVFHDGYDFSETLGSDGNFKLGAVNGGFSVDYNGIFTKDEVGERNFNSARAKVFAGSDIRDFLHLDGSLVLDLAADGIPHPYGKRTVNQRGLDFSVRASHESASGFTPTVDLQLKCVSYAGADEFAASFLGFAVTPHLKFKAGPVKIDAGLRIDSAGKLRLAPMVNASMSVFDNALGVYAGVTGGTGFNTLSEFVRECHWYSPLYSEKMTDSFERINARIGLRGGVFSRLEYDLCCGWASEKDMALWGVKNFSGNLSPNLGFRDVDYAYVNLMLAWKSDRFDADGILRYRNSQLDGCADVFDFPLFEGDFRLMYNWNKRIFAGPRVAFSTGRQARVSDVNLEMQPYIDLGIFGEYRLNSRLSFWIQGSNLLNESVQIVPMHVESGINFTGGICLSL